MDKIDFKECEFIHEQMRYFTFDDFYRERKAIKRLFNEMPKNGKRFYMWYVYSNTRMGLNKKNAIWVWLNEFKTDEQLLEIRDSVKWKN